MTNIAGVVPTTRPPGSRTVAPLGSDVIVTLTSLSVLGAAGYLTKSGSASDLIEAIEAVRAGRGYLSSSVARHVVDVIARQERGACSSASELTGREREVLQLVAEGLSSKEIACALSISTRTVESHRAKLMEKLGIHRVSGLVRLAIREGLIEP